MCFLALPVPPSKANLQPGSERESLVFSSASGMGLGAPQGLGRVLAAWCHTWSLLKPAGSREDLGHAPQGPEEQRLSPPPPHPAENQSGQGKRWSSSKLLKPRLREQRPGPHPPPVHTPLSFKGRGTRTPKMSQGQFSAPSSLWSPFHRPSTGCTWDITASRVLPRAPLPLPQGNPESAPPPPATPHTRPGTVQEAIGSLGGKRADPGEALRGEG